MSEPVPPVLATSQAIVLPSSQTSTALVYHAYPGPEISDAILEQCAELFSNNYGIWGKMPANMKGPKPGNRVKMSVDKLRSQLVSSPEDTVLVVCHQHINGQKLQLVGHAFATAWDYEGGRVGWITQLVVSTATRRRYIATHLLQMLKSRPTFQGISAIGLASSHPAACNALAKYSSLPIQSVDLTFCRQHAKAISERSPVEYVKKMELRGSLFEDNCSSGSVCSVFTSFYIDHTEPLEALGHYQRSGVWRFGELLDGHEFLIIVPVAPKHQPYS